MRRIFVILGIIIFISCTMAQCVGMDSNGEVVSDMENLVTVDTAISENAIVEGLLQDCLTELHSLSGDLHYFELMTASENALRILDTFHNDSMGGVITWQEVTNIEHFKKLVGMDLTLLSSTALNDLDHRVHHAGLLATMLASQNGYDSYMATALLDVNLAYAIDIPSALYVAKCENESGFVMGVWNNGNGIILVSARIFPNFNIIETDQQISWLFNDD